MKKAEKRKLKRMVNKERGRVGLKPPKKTRAEQVMMEPPISVLFVDNMRHWQRDCRRKRRGWEELHPTG